MMREDMIALALASGFKDKHMDAMFYESGPYDISFPTPALEAFYRAAFTAGQAEMRERAASRISSNMDWIEDVIRALPIEGENNVG